MSHQSPHTPVLEAPKYSKTYLYPKATNIYHYYANAYAFAEMVTKQAWKLPKQQILDDANKAWLSVRNYDRHRIYDEINKLLNTPIPPSPPYSHESAAPAGSTESSTMVSSSPNADALTQQQLQQAVTPNSQTSQHLSISMQDHQNLDPMTSTPRRQQQLHQQQTPQQSSQSSDRTRPSTDSERASSLSDRYSTPLSTPTSKNAAAQKQALQDIEEATRKAEEYKSLVTMTTDEDLAKDLYVKIQQAETTILENQKRLKRLKSGAEAQERFRQKRRKKTEDLSSSTTEQPFEMPEPLLDTDTGFSSAVESAIDEISEELRDISLRIHAHPETAMRETYAHEILTKFLESKGFTVTPGAFGLETAFVAEYHNMPESKSRTVAYISEYDALPDIGHGCDLIAISGVAAAYGTMCAMRAYNITGKVVLLGTPAEESIGGKIKLIHAGAYKKIDACLMVHPAHANALYGGYLALASVRVEYNGRAAHAAAAPWEGANALDAVVLAYNGISMLRQQVPPTTRIHGIITDGGKSPNVIPDHASALFFIRAATGLQLIALRQKITACLESTGMATGCSTKLTWEQEYYDVLVNEQLAERFGKYMTDRGVKYLTKAEELKVTKASTDMGNVSYEVPSIHAVYSIGTTHGLHTAEFAEAAKTSQAHNATMRAAKCLALTGLDVLVDDQLNKEAHKEFKAAILAQKQ
ncbi:6758_t:CDS:10 [Paraglomus occultum]|uniref:6758_t:CDS:1 n=1 Tax=Paraglomus occultum TaxID=144539 RepID=A0A9N9FFA9_9GLOM|nr:6758_t:CDS:10 [Paraglomus occultum]